MATIDLSKAIGLAANGTGYYTTSTSNVTTFTGSSGKQDGKVERDANSNYTYTANSSLTAGQTILATTSVAPWTITGTTLGDSIVGGQKADTIHIYGADTITGGAGADTIDFAGAGTAVMTDYSYTQGDVYNVAASALGAANFGSSGIILNGTTSLNISASESNGVYKVLAHDTASSGETLKVWFTGTTGAVLDAGAETTGAELIGSNNDAADTITGGSGKDTIYAGTGDIVNGGKGADSIELASDSKRETVQIAMTGGADTVANFSTGFEDTNDLVEITDGTFSVTDATLAGATLTIKDGSSASVALQGVYSDAASFLVKDTAGTHRVIAANQDSAQADQILIASTSADADFIIGSAISGTTTTLAFTGDTAAVAVDLSNGKGFGDTRQYADIHEVTGGAGKSTLAGSTASDTLMAGAGGSTLWGGAGTAADMLMGDELVADVFSYSGSAYKEGNDVIGLTNGGNAFLPLYDGGNAVLADILNLYDGVMPAVVTKSGSEGDVILKYDDEDTLTLKRMTNDATIRFITNGTTHGMKVGYASGSITASTNADYYYGTTSILEGEATYTTLKVAGAEGTTKSVYLDSSNGDTNTYVNLTHLTGTKTVGSLKLGGSTNSDTITAGGANASVWGGAGTAADVLAGGDGKDVFFYSANYKEGNDAITGFTNADDMINFYDGSTAFTATKAASGASAVVFKFDDNDTLTVTPTATDDDTAINVMFGTTAVKGVKVAGSNVSNSTLRREATAQYYFGSTNETAANKTTLTVAGTAGTTQTVYLDGTHGDSDVYVNINEIDGSKDTVGAKVLGGNTNANTITAGGTAASLWGGAGTAADSLVGTAASKDVFFYSGQYAEGQDTISTFDASSDVIDLYDGGVYTVTKATTGSNDVVLTYDSKNAITLQGVTADDEVINVMVGSTKVQGLKVAGSSADSTLTYTSDAAFYYGSTNAANKTTLELSSSEDQVVYLDGRSNGEHYENITRVTAANASGTVVIGGSTASDTITGSVNANSSLWGGAGDVADTMAGGTHTGKDMFWYGLGEGNDVITGASAEDTINLYNVDVMTDYKGTYSVGADTMAVQIGSDWLTVTRADNAATVSFVDKNGYTDTYNWTSKTWKSQSNS